MIRKALLILLTAGSVALATGCGSSSSTTKVSSTPSTSSSTPPSTSSTSSASVNPTVAQAVAKCKAVVNGRSTLSGSLKSKLIAICNKAGTGNATGLKQIFQQVCTQIVNSSIPSAAPKSLKDQALAECKKAFA